MAATFAAVPAFADRELHVVGVYEGTDGGTDGKINVNRAGHSVTLYLSSYDTIHWQVNVGAGTTIERVFLSGYYEQTVQGIPADVPVIKNVLMDGQPYLFVAYSVNSTRFLRAVPKLNQITGQEIASFHGSYQAPAEPFVIDAVQDNPMLSAAWPQPVPADQLPSVAYQVATFEGGPVRLHNYTLAGPPAGADVIPSGMRVSGDAAKRFYYGGDDGLTAVEAQSGATQHIPLPEDAQREGWQMGTAFDTLRNRGLVVTLAGEGFMYAYSPAAQQWSTAFSMHNRDFDCVEYHAATDTFYGVTTSHEDTVYSKVVGLRAADGSVVNEIPLPLLTFDIDFYDHRAEVVSAGEYLVLLLQPRSNSSGYNGGLPESRIYLIDPRTREIWLTYRSSRPANQPPVVQITSPSQGQAVTAGSTVRILANASDRDGSIQAVEFFVDDVSVGFGTREGTTSYRYDWTVPASGEHRLGAMARDNQGATGSSQPVTVRVIQPPAIRMFSPADGSTLVRGVPVDLIAIAEGANDSIIAVHFLIDGIPLGPALRIPGTNRFVASWTPNSTGHHTIQARTTGLLAVVIISPPITVHVVNPALTVQITRPAPGSSFPQFTRVELVASAISPAAEIVSVDFLVDGTSIGTAQPVPGSSNYVLSWEARALGPHSIVARATPHSGEAVSSAPVLVSVTPVEAPRVQIVRPATGSSFPQFTTVELVASAVAPGNEIVSLEFLVDGTSIGTAQRVPNSNNYALGWEARALGPHVIVARATPRSGDSISSVPIAVTVTPVEAPRVQIVRPASGSSFAQFTTVELVASAVAPGNEIVSLEFLVDGTSIGTAQRVPNSNNYALGWEARALGPHVIVARATPRSGDSISSVPIAVTVTPVEAPRVQIVRPASGSSFAQFTTVELVASAVAPGNEIVSLEFLVDGTSIGPAQRMPGTSNYTLVWEARALGPHSIVARATPRTGDAVSSAPILVTVTPIEAPRVQIIRPATGSSFVQFATVELVASAVAPGNEIVSLEFLVDGTSIGPAQRMPGTSNYTLVWEARALGPHSIVARATPRTGDAVSSAPISVTVTPIEPSRVQIIRPATGSSFVQFATVELVASAVAPGNEIVSLEFLVDGTSIGPAQRMPGTSNYTLVWEARALGPHVIVARATPRTGDAVSSAPISVTVTPIEHSRVQITRPATGSSFAQFTTVELVASAISPAAEIVTVDFLVDGTSIGTAHPVPGSNNHALNWEARVVGSHSIVARATSGSGSAVSSAPISVSVTAVEAPTVQITRPAAGSSFVQFTTVEVVAGAVAPGNDIVSVEFLVDGTSIGTGRRLPGSNSHALVWVARTAGQHSIAARATLQSGEIVSSAPTPVSVTSAAGTARRLLPTQYRPGRALRAGILVSPGRGAGSYTVTEHPPTGWAVRNISDGGTYDAATGTITFGPIAGGEVKLLSYSTTPPETVRGPQTFAGELTADGSVTPIAGQVTISSPNAKRRPLWRIGVK